jgi:uncharacterized membrane protein YhaH (DUF805 family)
MRMVNAYVNAIKNNYFRFHGRMARSEYWWFVLMYSLVILALFLIAMMIVIFLPPSMKDMGWIISLIIVFAYQLGLFIPTLTTQARRLHDIGFSGWWLLISLVPFGSIALLIMLILPAKPSGEKYGAYRDSASS